MQAEAELGRRRVGSDDPIRKRRIADRKVEAAPEWGTRVILPAHAGLGVNKGGDTCGDGIIFDARQAGAVAQRLWHQGEEQPGAHARLEHTARTEAEMLGSAPDRSDHRLRRVVGVLGRSLEGGIFRGGRGVCQVLADLLPAGPEIRLARQWKGILRHVRGAEADEAQEPLLLGGRGRTSGILQLLRQPNCRDVVAGAGGPATGKLPVAGKREVHPPLLRRERGGRVRLVVGVRLGRHDG